MIELLATSIITLSSVALFGYWFRYVCLMIVSTKTAQDYARQIAEANQLGFLGVRAALQSDAADLDRLRDVLDRDYEVLAGLLKHASSGQSGMEKSMLNMN